MKKFLPFNALHRLTLSCLWLAQVMQARSLWGVVVLVAIALSGCVQSDLGIEFHSPNRGEIVQQIELGERLQSLSGTSLQQWVRQLEQQASAVGGKVQKVSREKLTIRIPFTSSDDLEQKFNQFYGTIFAQDAVAADTTLPAIASQLTVNHSNFLLLERARLSYVVDLRSLGVSSSTGDILLSPASLIQLQFQLKTPWGARSVAQPQTLRPRPVKGGKILVWTLVPGEQNAIETVFWMPNPLGIGAVVILLLVLLGQFLKYPQSQAENQALKPSS